MSENLQEGSNAALLIDVMSMLKRTNQRATRSRPGEHPRKGREGDKGENGRGAIFNLS
jgi:hypothetical protein